MTITLQARVISVKIAQHEVANSGFNPALPDSYSNRRTLFVDLPGVLSVTLDEPNWGLKVPIDEAGDWLVGNAVSIAFTPSIARNS